MAGSVGPMKRPDFFIIPFFMDAAISGTGPLTNFRALDMRANELQIGWMVSLWGLAYALCCVPASKLSARCDRRFMLMLGTFVYACYALLCACATTPAGLIAAAPVGGVAAALFWPAFETLLHTDDTNETGHRVGLFNIGWTLGIMSGTAAAGYGYRYLGHPTVFLVVAAIALLNTVYIAWRTRHGIPAAAHHDAVTAPPSEYSSLPARRRTGYLYMAWIANFSLWFAGSAATLIFPKLSRSLSIGDQSTGLMLAVIWFGQIATFAAMSRSRRWRYRAAPLFAMQLVAAVGLLTLGVGSTALIFVVGYWLVGMARGLSYTSSLFYALDVGGASSANTGIHEAIVGASGVVAPLLAGAAAYLIGLRAPFVLAAAVAIFGLLAQALVWRGLPAASLAPAVDEGDPELIVSSK